MKKELRTKQLFWLSFLLLILLSAVSCLNREEKAAVHVRELASPSLLPEDLTRQKIYFVKNENDETKIFLTDLDQSQNKDIKLKKEGTDIVLSPSSRYIIYNASEKVGEQRRCGIWLHDIKTREEKNIILWPKSFLEVYLNSPNFFPNENKIIYAATYFDEEKYQLISHSLVNNSRKIITENVNSGQYPEVSPDGKKILTLCAGMDRDSHLPGFQLCIMNSDGTDHKIITHNGDSHGSYLFTPDSKHIVYTETETGGLLKIREKPYQRVYITDLEGSQHRILLDFQGAVRAISTDGEDIVLEGTPGDPYPWSIYLLGIDGTDLRHLSYFDDFLAEWYPEDD